MIKDALKNNVNLDEIYINTEVFFEVYRYYLICLSFCYLF